MGVLDAKNDFERAVKACTKVPARVQRKPKTEVPEGEIRRSSRPRPEVGFSAFSAPVLPYNRQSMKPGRT